MTTKTAASGMGTKITEKLVYNSIGGYDII